MILSISFNEITDFLKNEIIGLVILGLISSFVAAFFYDFIKSQIKLTRHKIKRRLHVKKLVKIAESFGQGSRAFFADKGTTFQQQVLIGDYIIKTIMLVGWILFYLLLSIVAFIILGRLLSWIPVIVFSSIITIRYKKLKQHLEHFQQTFKHAYGEEYFEMELKGQKEYWDKLFKKSEE